NHQSVTFIDKHPPATNLLAEVVDGLSKPDKRLPPKFFYNKRGSQLFSAICETDEYYQTRTENQLLQDHAEDLAEFVSPGCTLIEPGSGNSQKVRHLLPVVQPSTYVAIDISKQFLLESTAHLAEEFPKLDVVACCADFTRPISLPELNNSSERLIFFPGSSIGNFEPAEAAQFLTQLADLGGTGSQLLIGVDLKKSVDRLNAAYNDKSGYTEEFNLNLLHRINEELRADFNPDYFAHDAFYNDKKGRVEMHLRSKRSQEVSLNGKSFQFAADETVHTENSYKYHVEEFAQLAASAGYELAHAWKDAEELFSIQLYQCM
ncbi:MAG TPA: L-histidine N(alpha)-methyltransferase, partial [Gammaproteobacteria bacterium]|nr:L-histidine N(alpha)-methyltransferase [Gammaproteobacteria bacterium]